VISHSPVSRARRESNTPVFARITDESKIFPQISSASASQRLREADRHEPVRGQRNQWGGNSASAGERHRVLHRGVRRVRQRARPPGDPDRRSASSSGPCRPRRNRRSPAGPARRRPGGPEAVCGRGWSGPGSGAAHRRGSWRTRSAPPGSARGVAGGNLSRASMNSQGARLQRSAAAVRAGRGSRAGSPRSAGEQPQTQAPTSHVHTRPLDRPAGAAAGPAGEAVGSCAVCTGPNSMRNGPVWVARAGGPFRTRRTPRCSTR